MKKKLLTLTIIATMALSFVACGGSSDTKVIESNTGDSAAAGTSQAAASFAFTYDGLTISPDDDVAPIIEKLGEPNQYFESPSCAAEGIGKLYTYSDFEIQTYPDGDVDRVLYVLLRTDNVATQEGVDLSSSREDVLAAYDTPTEENDSVIKFEKNGTTLQFLFDGDTLISIEYDSSMNK